jgi:hypothetical protein
MPLLRCSWRIPEASAVHNNAEVMHSRNMSMRLEVTLRCDWAQHVGIGSNVADNTFRGLDNSAMASEIGCY